MPFLPWAEKPFGQIKGRDIMISGNSEEWPLQIVKKSLGSDKFPGSGALSKISADYNQIWLYLDETLVEGFCQMRCGSAKVKIRYMDKSGHEILITFVNYWFCGEKVSRKAEDFFQLLRLIEVLMQFLYMIAVLSQQFFISRLVGL